MAVTADQVEVRLRADTAQYVRNLTQADAAFSKTAAGIQANSAKVSAATNNLSLNTGNIAAQFQDIGVTAAAGMNPLIIALQQGTQLSAVLSAEVGKGVNPVKALGGAFLQVLNPISLATIAAVALGAALLQSLGSVLPKTQTANEALKAHRAELEKIVKGYSVAEDAVSAYFDRVEQLPRGIAIAQTNAEFEKLSQEVTDFTNDAANGAIQAFIRMSATGGETATTAEALTRDFVSGGMSAEEYYLAMTDLRASMTAFEGATASIPGTLGNIIDRMIEGALKATIFGDALERLIAISNARIGLAVDEDLQNALDLKTYIAQQEALNASTAEELALRKEIDRQLANASDIGLTYEKAVELAEAALAADKARAQVKKDAGGGAKAATEYESERQAVLDLMEALGFQAAILGQSNREKAIAVALSKANATATQEELNTISQTAGFIYDTEQAIKDLNETSTEWANTIQSATRGFIDDLIAGKSAAEAFSNVLADIGSKLIDVGLNSLFGGSGFNLAGLFGGTSTRATGGSVYAGKPTLVGEKGPEMFIPSTPGKIVPNSQVGGGGSVTFAPVIDARGADVAAVARLERVVQDMAANVVPTIRSEMATARKKGR